MNKKPFRMERINGLVQQEIARVVQQEIKDPRVKMISINAVRVSRDLRHARLYITALDNNSAKEIVEVLNRAQKFIRSRLAEKINLRYTPQLRFLLDEHVIKTNRLISAIEKANQSNNSVNKNKDSFVAGKPFEGNEEN